MVRVGVRILLMIEKLRFRIKVLPVLTFGKQNIFPYEYVFRTIGRKKQELVYSDPNTYSGPDEQPLFDFDDELVVMAKDLGFMRPAKSDAKPMKFLWYIIKCAWTNFDLLNKN